MRYLNSKNYTYSKGFTMVELLLSFGIVVLLGFVSFSILRSGDNKEVLDKSTLGAVAILEQARASTLASKDSYQYGVHFDTNQMVLFRGSTYSSASTTNQIASIDQRVYVSGFALAGGGHDVIFKRLTGATDTSGTITLSLAASSTITKTVTIYATGIIDRN